MKKFIFQFSLVLLFLVVSVLPGSFFVGTANAQISICTLAPFLNGLGGLGISICDQGGNVVQTNDTGEAANTIGEYIRFGLSLVFVGVIAFAVYTVIKSAIKYIQSEGDETKVEEAQKAIKTVFVGIGTLFVGIIGLIIIIVFFNASGALTAGDAPEGSGIQDFLDGVSGGNTQTSNNSNGGAPQVVEN